MIAECALSGGLDLRRASSTVVVHVDAEAADSKRPMGILIKRPGVPAGRPATAAPGSDGGHGDAASSSQQHREAVRTENIVRTGEASVPAQARSTRGGTSESRGRRRTRRGATVLQCPAPWPASGPRRSALGSRRRRSGRGWGHPHPAETERLAPVGVDGRDATTAGSSPSAAGRGPSRRPCAGR